MYIKFLNYILIIILLTIISAIIFEELNYNRLDRYYWEVHTNFSNDNGPINIIEGKVTNKKISVELSKNSLDPYYSGFKNTKKELPPDSIHLKWFSYPDNKFFQLNKKISESKILEFLKRNKNSDYNLEINFKKDGKVDLLLFCNENDSFLIDSFKGENYETKWMFGEDKATDVYMMNLRTIIFPEINIKSQSKYNHLDLFYKDNNGIGIGINDNNFDFNNYDFDKGKVYKFEIFIKFNKLNNDELLKVKVEYSDIEMAEILRKLSKEKVYFSMHFNSLDSLENIFIRDSSKKIRLENFKVKYEIKYDYDSSGN